MLEIINNQENADYKCPRVHPTPASGLSSEREGQGKAASHSAASVEKWESSSQHKK